MDLMAAMVRNSLVTHRALLSPPSGRFLAPRTSLSGSVCAIGLLLSLPITGFAAEWRFQPSLTIIEEYTDNVTLLPASQRQSDFITQINPGLTVNGRGSRASFQANYTLQNVLYGRDSSRNALNHLLSATGKAEIIPNWFLFDARAEIARQNVSSAGLLGINTNNDNRNTVENRTYLLSPYVRDRIGTALEYEVRYQRDHASTADQGSLPSSDANRASASLRSGPAYTRTAWGITYNKQTVDYSEGQPTTRTENVVANGRYSIEPRFALLGTIGYEKNDYAVIGPKPQGTLWNAGFAWQPSKLTSLTATGGERFFGKTYALDFVQRSRSFFWNVRYSENIGSSRDQSLSTNVPRTSSFVGPLAGADIADPTERARFVDDFIIRNGLPTTIFAASDSLTNRNFLEKRLGASVTYNTPRNTSILSIFRVNRDADAIGTVPTGPGTDDVAANVNVVQTGGSLLVNWRVAPRTGLDFSVGADEYRFRNADRDDKVKYVRLGLRHRLRPKVTGALDYRHVERDSNAQGAEYKENAISAALVIRF